LHSRFLLAGTQLVYDSDKVVLAYHAFGAAPREKFTNFLG
jgi:hypothetical protein